MKVESIHQIHIKIVEKSVRLCALGLALHSPQNKFRSKAGRHTINYSSKIRLFNHIWDFSKCSKIKK